jgi:dipeptidyl aminopeptidase/acylaminoacyl peptidase
MDEGRPPDPANGPESAPPEPFAPPVATEPIDPVDVEPIAPRGPGRATIALVVVLILAFISFAVVGGRILIAGPDTTSRPQPRLAVTDAAGHLHTMDSEGRTILDYAVPGVEFGFPTWSPDASRIAVTGNDKDSTAIYVFNAADAGAKPAVIYDSGDKPPFYVYWSPDGRQLAFLAQEPDKIALEVAPADGSAKPTVVREGAPLYWDWLGSEHMVAHVGSSGASSFLGEVALDGTSAEKVPLSAGLFRSPAVSHDGAYRAYVTTGNDAAGVVTVEASDRSRRETAPAFGSAAVSFDPAGATLAYVAAKQPVTNDPGFPLGPLRAIDPASGQTRTLLDGDVIAFFWSPDGKTIAALTLKSSGNEVVGISGARLASAARPASGAPDTDASLAYVPMTLSFVDVASASVRAHRAVAVSRQFVNGILPYYDQYALSHHVWAPDSSAIALPGFGNGGDQLFAIPADGSEPTGLDGAVFGFWSP